MKKILIVEDDEAIRNAIQFLLQENGYEVIMAANGRQALTQLQNESIPNLIFLDLMMPIMDGIEFRDAQQNDLRLKGIPVVFMSAGQVDINTLHIDSDHFLRKPFSISDILRSTTAYCA